MGDLDLDTLTTLHFGGWNSMPHLDSHSAKASRSCCRTEQSLWSYIGLYTMQSSANKRVLEMILSGRSLINSRNSKGPGTEPSGIPLTTGTLSEKHPSTVTLWVMSRRNEVIHWWVFFLMT